MPRVTSKALPRARPAQSTIQPPQRESNACFTRHPFPRPKTSRMSPRRPKAALVLAERPDILGGMWDRYDPRDERDRHRAGSWDRPRGSRGGRSERDDNRVFDPRDVFVRAVDLPRGRERRPVQERERVLRDQRHREPHAWDHRRVPGLFPRAICTTCATIPIIRGGEGVRHLEGGADGASPLEFRRPRRCPDGPRARPARSQPIRTRRPHHTSPARPSTPASGSRAS